MGWSLLDHTGDIGLEVEAPTLEGLFAEALRGFTDCVTDVGRVRETIRREVELEAQGTDLLLVDWLAEALYLFDTERLLFARAAVELERGGAPGVARLRAGLAGEHFDADRHPLKAPIKAVTYHALELGQGVGGWRARLVFDL